MGNVGQTRDNMTTQEFIQRRHRYFKAIALPALAELALIVAPPLVFLCLAPRHPGWPTGAVWLAVILLVPPALWGPGLYLYAVYVRRVATDSGLRCPHCQKFLISPGLAKRALASGKCPRCGQRVLDDTP